MSYRAIGLKTLKKKYFFSTQCIITLWDSLSQSVVEACDMNRFKKGTDYINGG